MPSVKFNKSDFQGKTPMTPGWYLLDIGGFDERESKGKDSTNFWGEYTVAQGDFQGTVIAHCFSEKAITFAGGAGDYMACFTDNTDALVDKEVIDALKMTSGRQVMGYVEWNPEFRKNQVKDWRPVK